MSIVYVYVVKTVSRLNDAIAENINKVLRYKTKQKYIYQIIYELNIYFLKTSLFEYLIFKTEFEMLSGSFPDHNLLDGLFNRLFSKTN